MFSIKIARKPVFAGQFYPQSDVELSSVISRFLEQEKLTDKKVRAIIVPHAGYVYSGAIAGLAYKQTINHNYKRIVLLAPSHRVSFRGIAFSGYAEYMTPLGNVKVDEHSIEHILKSSSNMIGQLDDAHINEHSLEVQLPFIQTIHPNSKLVPIVCGELDLMQIEEITNELSDYWDEDTLWVISSDFTHYGGHFHYKPFDVDVEENIKKLDQEAIKLITELNLTEFNKFLNKTKATICGSNPIKLLIDVINASCENIKIEQIAYDTSGHMTGDFSTTVSYASLVAYDC
jgi:AmmeMemoRadiSam system protein B